MNTQLQNHKIMRATLMPNDVMNYDRLSYVGREGYVGKESYLDRESYVDRESSLAVLTICDSGMIRDCSRVCAELLGCAASKLTWQHISTFLPQLADIALVKGGKINPNLRFLSHAGHHFEAVGMSGVRFACELFFNEVENLSQHCLRIIIQPIAQGQAAS